MVKRRACARPIHKVVETEIADNGDGTYHDVPFVSVSKGKRLQHLRQVRWASQHSLRRINYGQHDAPHRVIVAPASASSVVELPTLQPPPSPLHQPLDRLESRLVGHLAALRDPVAEIQI